MQRRFLLFYTLLLLLTGATTTTMITPVRAHGGGTPRLTDVAVGPYQIFVWSQPEPLRVGEVHLTIGLTRGDQTTDPSEIGAAAQDNVLVQPVTDATVHVRMVAAADPTQSIETLATVGGLGSVYYETDASLPTAGQWRFILEVSGDAGSGTVEFHEEVVAARTLNVPLLIGAALLFVIGVGLVGVWNRRTGEKHEVSQPV